MSKKVCAISVDLDPIRFYEQIHGIAPTTRHGVAPNSSYGNAPTTLHGTFPHSPLSIASSALQGELLRPASIPFATDHLIYRTAIERISGWARELLVPITWFVVGSELNSPEVTATLAELYARGDELANHTEHHHYDLTQRSSEKMLNEIDWVTEKL
jgi:hypothetical protein